MNAPADDPPESEWAEPLLLGVRHETRFLYEGPVFDSFNEARLQPVTDHAQSCREFHLHIEPEARVNSYPDFHGNGIHYFDVTLPHETLLVCAESIVATHPDARGPAPAENPPAARTDPEILENCFEYLNVSEFVSLGSDVWREAVDAVPGGLSDLWLDGQAIGRHIFRSFTYTPNATSVNTLPSEVIRTRQGVCQDFAHVMLGMCRSLGIPARYVSGYFLNSQRLPGEFEASHAWVEVFLPGFGWKGFDPTHDRVPDTRYVKVAVGRDYADIRPISGTFRGCATRKMGVRVEVTRLTTDALEVASTPPSMRRGPERF